MKRIYQKPAIKKMVARTSHHMMTGSNESWNEGNLQSLGGASQSNERRGGWGNIWNYDE